MSGTVLAFFMFLSTKFCKAEYIESLSPVVLREDSKSEHVVLLALMVFFFGCLCKIWGLAFLLNSVGST